MKQSIIKDEQKQCGHCKKMKYFSKFTKDNRAKCGLKSECDECRAESRRKLRKSKRQKINQLKETTPCKDCKKYYPSYVMQFDHLPGKGRVKKFQLNNGQLYSDIQIQEEIAKCEIVCANCHAIRTHIRR
jgi:hypothetical protein